jgi:hypothetical protein
LAYTLCTAFVAFSAAVRISRERGFARCVLCTGHWGCGAFGNHRIVIAVLQHCAALLAGVDEVRYHCGDAPSAQAVGRHVMGLMPRRTHSANLVDWLHALEGQAFCWQRSNGT